MADQFVEIDVTTDSRTLADGAVDVLRSRWPTWEPNEADLTVVIIESVAPMAQNAAETAARVPSAIIRKLGTNLYGVPYQEGVAAVAELDLTFADTEGYTIPSGAEFDIDGFAFATTAIYTVPPGVATLEGVIVTARDVGTQFNGLLGSLVAPVSSISALTQADLQGPTAGGVDAEDDTAYQNRLSRELQLQAKTLVTARDFELLALSDPLVGRAYAANNGDRAITVVLTGFDGEVVATYVKDRIALQYADYRLVNTTYTMSDATYTTVHVTYAVKKYPGYDSGDLILRINAALAGYLNPSAYGRANTAGESGTGVWINAPIVRKNKIIDLIGDVDGVDYVDTLTLSGSAGTVDGSGNLTMPGTYALPRAGTFTGSAS